jgi:phytoene desaturase
MPDLLERCFSAAGESMSDWLQLDPIDPLYRAWFPDASRLDVKSDPQAMAAEVERVCGPAEAAGYERFVEFVTQLYRLQISRFIDRNIDSPVELLTPDLARLVGLGAFRRMTPKTRQFFQNPRTERVFSFQSMYAGLSPFQALAIYSVISYMDSVAGVYAPKGGMHEIARAMAGAAEKRGVSIQYNCEVERVEMKSQRAHAVVTTSGERIPCDAVVLNPDLPVAMRSLLGREPWSVRRLKYSPSCFLLLVGSDARYKQLAHHNIHFGESWKGVFDELIRRKTLMSDPSFLVSNPTHSDASLAPKGKHVYYVFFPTPNMEAGIDWNAQASPYREEVLRTLEERGYVGFTDGIEVEHQTTPLDWEHSGLERGTPFAASHTFLQTGPFRPRNLWGQNVVFAGSGTTPGVGVPMVLISGRLAAERITGRTASDI